MWVLIVVTLMSSGGVTLEGYGEYVSHGSCIVAMREAEIAINEPNEGMLCLHMGEME